MAKRLGRSSSLIQKWCEPSTDFTDSGAYNPLDRIQALIDEAKSLGKSPHEIFAPIRFLAKGNGVFIPLPQSNCTPEEITLQTARTMQRVGEALAEAGNALQDLKLTPNERRDVLKKMDRAVHDLLTLQGMFYG